MIEREGINVPGKAISELDADAALQPEDLIPIVKAGGGKGSNRKTTIASLRQAMALDGLGVPSDSTELDATPEHHGLMPKLDKIKLDGIEESSVSLATVKADADVSDALLKRHTQDTDTDLNPPHKDATTGVHGVGAGTVAKIADIAATKLDELTAPDDNSDLNATTSRHGLLPKLGGGTTNFFRADGGWATPSQSDIGEGHITILPWHYSGITQGTWIVVSNAASLMAGYFQNTSDAQNDRIDYKAFLSAGTYTFSLMCAKNTTCAISTILIDGSSVGTLDWYDALTYDVVQTITGIVVATPGLKTISIKAATRNAGAGGWALYLCSMALFRTA